MKFLSTVCLFATFLMFGSNVFAQKDKSKRPSPPALVTKTIGETTIKIDYSQPSVKGRTIGKDLEPKEGEVWRTGANEATVFETDKDVMINGEALPKGKYALFALVKGDEWIFIFNKTWSQWGAYDYKEKDDALRVTVKAGKAAAFAEKMTITISEKGKVNLLWGDIDAEFTVK
jgi:hypothetical protein